MLKHSWISLFVVMVATAGCDNSFRLVEVEGLVTLKGEPLEDVRVEFWPLSGGPQSAAKTNADGRFSLMTWDGEKQGAVLGTHKVVLRDTSIVILPFEGRASADVDLTAGQKPRFAMKYSNPTTTPLEVEITGERRDLVFDLEPYRR
jgi:hypothetical protein